jgi:iron complex outermembrane recepter protein
MKRVIGLLVLQLICLSSIANTFIYGIVTGIEGKPLIGANVVIEGSFSGTATNADGRFRLNVRDGQYGLRVSHIGYETVSHVVNVSGETRLDISLDPLAYLGEEVIVSATRAHSKVPMAYTDVSRSEIENRDFGKDIPYLISLTPSFVASSDAGTGIGYTSFRIRGSDMNRINVTINGIPLNDSESHGVWWVNMPDFASSVDNVQIQRGVGTSSHGAGAFGASINLQTSTLNTDPYGEINSSAGSFNSLRNTVRLGSGMINDRFTFDARLSRISSDGYIDRASSDLKSFFISGSMHSETSLLRVNVFSGREVTYQAWDGVPSAMLDVNRRFNGIGKYTNELGETAYYDNETDNYQQDHFQMFYSKKILSGLHLNTALHYTRGYGYYEQYKANHRFSNYGIDTLEIGDQKITRSDLIRRKVLDNDFYGMTYSLKYNRRSFDLTIGGAVNQYIGDHYGNIIWAQYGSHIPKNHEWYFNEGKKNDFNIFGKLDYRISDKINFYGDLQYRAINYSIKGIDDDIRDISRDHEYHFFNPKAGVFYEFDSRQNVYLSYAVAHREPNRSNFKDARPDEIPRPERLGNLETGYNLKTRNINLNANLFYMNYSDQLVLTGQINDVGAPVMTNVPESYRAGIELIAGMKISPQFEFAINLSLSENRIKDFTEYVDNWDYWGDPENEPEQVVRHIGNTELSFSPPLVSGGEVSWRPADRLSINFMGKYVDRQFIDNTANTSRMLDSYFFSDLRFHYAIETSWIGELGISMLIGNIFNAKFETNAWIYRYKEQGVEQYMDGFFPQAGRHFFSGVSIKF